MLRKMIFYVNCRRVLWLYSTPLNPLRISSFETGIFQAG